MDPGIDARAHPLNPSGPQQTPQHRRQSKRVHVNPVAATLFFGLVLTIVVYSALDLTGTMSQLGPFGAVIPLLVIFWLMVAVSTGA
jgi:hypothetical protein